MAARIFQGGLCSCGDATIAGTFSSDGFDSSQTLDAMPAPEATVGINGHLSAVGLVNIEGALLIGGGPSGIAGGQFRVSGDLKTNGDLTAVGAGSFFGGDAWVNGELVGAGLIEVAGDVYQTPGHDAPFGVTVGGKAVTQDFALAKPCPCEADELLDIDRIIAQGLSDNDNQAAGLSAATLVTLGSSTLDLGCGRYAFAGGSLAGNGVVHTSGRTALFIDGDFDVAGLISLEPGPDAELDIFVRGNLLITGAQQIGSKARPAALRFYVGGAGDIALAGANVFAANLYASRANVFVAGAEDLYGSFLVGSWSTTGIHRLHYDAAIGQVGADVCGGD